jgi:uncharacterized membrane protein YhiD involved in acid resistance
VASAGEQADDKSPREVPPTGATLAVVNTGDLILDLNRITQSRNHWRRGALAGTACAAFFFILSFVQFFGTFTACKLVQEARRQSAELNAETADYLRDIRLTQERIEAACTRVQQDLRTVGRWKAEQNRLDDLAQNRTQQINQLEAQLKHRQELLDAMEERRKAMDSDWQEFLRKNQTALPPNVRWSEIPETLAAFLPTLPGHEPDNKNCPAGLRRVVDDD